jgi:hypothetical protein
MFNPVATVAMTPGGIGGAGAFGSMVRWAARWLQARAVYSVCLETPYSSVKPVFCSPGLRAPANLLHMLWRQRRIPYLVHTGLLGQRNAFPLPLPDQRKPVIRKETATGAIPNCP